MTQQLMVSFKKVIGISLVLLVAPIIVNGQQSPRDVVKHGEEVFGTTCAFCHGEGGSGASGPRLSGRGFDGQYIEKVITYGVAGTAMPAWGQRLIAQDYNGVIAYVKSLNGIVAPLNEGSPAVLSGEAARGRDLFRDATRELGSCSNCHAVDGRGVNMAPPIRNVPSGATALRSLATPQVKTAMVNSESFPAIVVSQSRDETKLYDLTTVPPVLRTFPSSAVKVTDGSTWQHATVMGTTFSNEELDLILAFLRAGTKSGPTDAQPAASSQGQRSMGVESAQSNSGSFAEQSIRGKEKFDGNCAYCHGRDLSGHDPAPALSGDTFMSDWGSRMVGDLFDKIRTTMPQTSPGSLNRQTYLDIVAYLLQANGMASDKDELKDNPDALKNMKVGKN
jgi:mono/diheme cytochrome c family protein